MLNSVGSSRPIRTSVCIETCNYIKVMFVRNRVVVDAYRFYFTYEIRQCGVGAISSGITSVPNFVKIKQLVQKGVFD